MDHMALSKAIEYSSIHGETEESRNAILANLQKIIKEDFWVWIPVQERGNQTGLCTVDMHNGVWFVMFSEKKHVRTGENIGLLSMGMKILLEPLLQSPEVSGIAINPFSREHAFIPRQVFVDILDSLKIEDEVLFVKNAIKRMITEFGEDIFNNQDKACNIVADVFLDKIKLKNIAKTAIRLNIIGRLKKALSEGEAQGIEMVNNMTNYLSDEMGLEQKYARIVVSGFYLALVD